MDVSFSREQEMGQRYDSSVPSLAMRCASAVPFSGGVLSTEGLEFPLLDHFLPASATNFRTSATRITAKNETKAYRTHCDSSNTGSRYRGPQHMNQKFVQYEGFSPDTKFSIKCSGFLCLELVYTV